MDLKIARDRSKLLFQQSRTSLIYLDCSMRCTTNQISCAPYPFKKHLWQKGKIKTSQRKHICSVVHGQREETPWKLSYFFCYHPTNLIALSEKPRRGYVFDGRPSQMYRGFGSPPFFFKLFCSVETDGPYAACFNLKGSRIITPLISLVSRHGPLGSKRQRNSTPTAITCNSCPSSWPPCRPLAAACPARCCLDPSTAHFWEVFVLEDKGKEVMSYRCKTK